MWRFKFKTSIFQRTHIVLIVGLVLVLSCDFSKKEANKSIKYPHLPNILLIYMDDLGYGDVSSYKVGTLETTNIDRIAKNGIRFTNGYATSATCTPSRYAILSGEYPWRNQKSRILPGNAPLLFDTSRETLPSMLKKANYTTAVIGKWHLGLGKGSIDWNASIKPGPNEIGFDYSYILASTNDRVPSVYLENDRVVGLDLQDSLKVSYNENFPGEPTGKKNPELLKIYPSHGHDMSIHNGISRIGYMKGGKSALFIDEDMSDTIMIRTKNFIKSNKDNPFFLFYSLHQPHVPRVPHPRFVGSSGMGPRGDAILEADWAIGQILDQLSELGIAENTMVIFSSDNGPVLDDGYIDNANEKLGNHTPRGGLRGGKYSMFEAGTRIPFMVSWPGKIKPRVSDALVCQLDFMGSLASLIGLENPSSDSKNTLDAFLGNSDKGRDELVLEASGKIFFRQGSWVMIPPYKGSKISNKWGRNETGNSEEYQLYNLDDDLEQQENLASEYPEKVQKMLVAMRNVEGK